MAKTPPNQLYYGAHPDPKMAEELRLLWTHIHTTAAQASANETAATAQARVIRQHDALLTQPATPSNPPRGSGASDSILLGLPVAPLDTTAAATGVTLKFNKAKGILEFS